MNQKIARQPKAVSIWPPSQGAIIGATTITMVTVAIWLADMVAARRCRG